MADPDRPTCGNCNKKLRAHYYWARPVPRENVPPLCCRRCNGTSGWSGARRAPLSEWRRDPLPNEEGKPWLHVPCGTWHASRMMRPKRDASQVRSYGIANAFCSAHCTTQYALKAFYAVHPERKPKT